MREMQAKAFEKRDAQYLLIKAPPACGKSRALMFIALDKLANQGLEKVIVAVPQKAIAGSFKSTELKEFGQNWEVDPKYELCTKENSEQSNVKIVNEFLNDKKASVLVCAHATLVNFYKSLNNKHLLDKTLIAIDEFHHVSASEDSRLGEVVHSLINDSKAHIIAMTGSYFRGDRIPVLDAEDEQQFEQVVYTYYQQLNGYTWLKNLKLDYTFYDTNWLEGLDLMINPPHPKDDYSKIKPEDYYNPEYNCFDPDMKRPFVELKTIIYIPSVMASASTGDKYNEFLKICDILGQPESGTLQADPKTGFYTIKTWAGKTIKVANLIFEDMQDQSITSLRNIKSCDEVDVIVALGMAKEGFDWPWCEHVIVSGFRKSMTEVIQIIGRATRDCENKTIALFTNLIKVPDASLTEAKSAVDDIIKAISLSLMMEQVLQPNIKFVPRSEVDEVKSKITTDEQGQKIIIIDDEHLSPKVKQVMADGETIQDLTTTVINNLDEYTHYIVQPEEHIGKYDDLIKASISNLIKEKLPRNNGDWEDHEVDQVSSLIMLTLKSKPEKLQLKSQDRSQDRQEKSGKGSDQTSHNNGSSSELTITSQGNALLEMRKDFINVSELDISLLEKCHPFGNAYEIISQMLTAPVLKQVQEYAINHRSGVTENEATTMLDTIKKFIAEEQRLPDITSSDLYERRLAEILIYCRKRKAQLLKE